MAYVLGFMFADGYVYENPRGGCYFCFCSTDPEIIETIKRVIGSAHKIGVKKADNRFSRSSALYTLQIGSKETCGKLALFGVVQNKSLTVRFPKVPREFFGDFVRGYFDGDGSANFGRYWVKARRNWKYQFTVNFTSGSIAFLEGLFLALESYVKGGRIGTKERGYELVFSQNDAFALYKLMYNNISSELFLRRKLDVFERAFQALQR